jgi:hypothetical protein
VDHEAAVALHVVHYNSCRVHQTLSVTPAMQAGPTNRVWEMADLIAARRSRQKSRVVHYPEARLKQHLKTCVTLAAVAVLIVVSSWMGLLIWGRSAGPTVDETGIVTVVAYVDGNHDRSGGHFRHLVRTTSGAEYRMTFGELYPVGSRLSVNYRRFTRGDTIKVMFYSRVPE